MSRHDARGCRSTGGWAGGSAFDPITTTNSMDELARLGGARRSDRLVASTVMSLARCSISSTNNGSPPTSRIRAASCS